MTSGHVQDFKGNEASHGINKVCSLFFFFFLIE
jgi:hypothetical protein